jgi:hypothetical protein
MMTGLWTLHELDKSFHPKAGRVTKHHESRPYNTTDENNLSLSHPTSNDHSAHPELEKEARSLGRVQGRPAAGCGKAAPAVSWDPFPAGEDDIRQLSLRSTGAPREPVLWTEKGGFREPTLFGIVSIYHVLH